MVDFVLVMLLFVVLFSVFVGVIDGVILLVWFVCGLFINCFDDKSNKGIDIGGKCGDVVVVVDDGKVIYVGFLCGYGNFVIIKYNDMFLIVYGNNDKVLVIE